MKKQPKRVNRAAIVLIVPNVRSVMVNVAAAAADAVVDATAVAVVTAIHKTAQVNNRTSIRRVTVLSKNSKATTLSATAFRKTRKMAVMITVATVKEAIAKAAPAVVDAVAVVVVATENARTVTANRAQTTTTANPS